MQEKLIARAKELLAEGKVDWEKRTHSLKGED